MAEPALPLAAPPTPRERFREDIRRIATYRSEDPGGEGTCGYKLTEAEFAAIGRAADWYAAALVEECARTPASQRRRHA